MSSCMFHCNHSSKQNCSFCCVICFTCYLVTQFCKLDAIWHFNEENMTCWAHEARQLIYSGQQQNTEGNHVGLWQTGFPGALGKVGVWKWQTELGLYEAELMTWLQATVNGLKTSLWGNLIKVRKTEESSPKLIAARFLLSQDPLPTSPKDHTTETMCTAGT